MGKRHIDVNGYMVLEANPISTIGVFPYYGKDIDYKKEKEFGLDPDAIYWVYRGPDALFEPEAVKSFDGKPFIKDHTFLGRGKMPVDQRPVDGCIFNVRPSLDMPNYLLADFCIYTEKMKAAILSGEKELSLGYRCKYRRASGEYDGKHYDFEQYEIRGNHIALVERGRCGSSVCVCDSAITCDSLPKEIVMNENEQKQDDKFENLANAVAKGSEEDAQDCIDFLALTAEQRKAALEYIKGLGENKAEDAKAADGGEDVPKAPDAEGVVDAEKKTCDCGNQNDANGNGQCDNCGGKTEGEGNGEGNAEAENKPEEAAKTEDNADVAGAGEGAGAGATATAPSIAVPVQSVQAGAEEEKKNEGAGAEATGEGNANAEAEKKDENGGAVADCGDGDLNNENANADGGEGNANGSGDGNGDGNNENAAAAEAEKHDAEAAKVGAEENANIEKTADNVVNEEEKKNEDAAKVTDGACCGEDKKTEGEEKKPEEKKTPQEDVEKEQKKEAVEHKDNNGDGKCDDCGKKIKTYTEAEYKEAVDAAFKNGRKDAYKAKALAEQVAKCCDKGCPVTDSMGEIDVARYAVKNIPELSAIAQDSADEKCLDLVHGYCAANAGKKPMQKQKAAPERIYSVANDEAIAKKPSVSTADLEGYLAS